MRAAYRQRTWVEKRQMIAWVKKRGDEPKNNGIIPIAQCPESRENGTFAAAKAR